MSTRTKILDAATILDDFIEDLGLPEERWVVQAQLVTELDAGDELLEQMRHRIAELYDPLPFHVLKVTLKNGPFGINIARTEIKGKDVKMAIKMAVMGLDNSNIEFEQVEPWPTNG